MKNEIVNIGFDDGYIEAIQDENEDIWISVKRVCKELRIDAWRQSEKLKNKAWAVTNMMLATGPDGKRYRTFMILKKSFFMWLATIDANRVRVEIRPKLEAYQTRAMDVIDQYFSGLGIPRSHIEALEANRRLLDKHIADQKKIQALMDKNRESQEDISILERQKQELERFANVGLSIAGDDSFFATLGQFSKFIEINGLTIGPIKFKQYLEARGLIFSLAVKRGKKDELEYFANEKYHDWFTMLRSTITKRKEKIHVNGYGAQKLIEFMYADPDFWKWSREKKNPKARDRQLFLPEKNLFSFASTLKKTIH